MPLALPVLATLAIIDVLDTWNELLTALVLISSRTNGRCRSGCYSFGASSRRHTELTAAILIVILPILVLYILFQRYLISGLTAGALKE